MSSEINNDNAKAEQPSDLFQHLQQNLDTAQEKICNKDQSVSESINSDTENKIQQPQEPESHVNIEAMEEDTIIDKVNKLNIEVKTDESTKPHDSTGEVVYNKLSESLSYLQDYNSGDDEEEDDENESSDSDNDEIQDLQFHDLLEGDSEDSESDSDAEEYDSIYGDGPPSESTSKTSKTEEQKTEASWMSDFGVDMVIPKIPDISSLELNNKEEFLHIGNVDCILDKFVTIQGLPGVPAYDLDTLFFLEEGQKILGYVFDVMGPVSSPIYVVHADSVETVQELQIVKGVKIYSAPKSKYTKYVFVHELMKIRGSDASWVGDTEVPPELQEFSDDEEERQVKTKNKVTKRKHGSLERHQEFEANMNKINQLNSRLHSMVDTHHPLRQRINVSKNRKSRQKGGVETSCVAVPAHLLGHPPPHAERSVSDCPPYVGTQCLQTYFQNCTSQFLQHWKPQVMDPPATLPPQQYYAPPSVPVFDPSTPPPNYRSHTGYLTINPYANGSQERSDAYVCGNFQHSWENNRPGPSNGN